MSKPLNQDDGIEDRQKMVPPEMEFEPIRELTRMNKGARKPDKRASDEQVHRKP
ncbi:MULTISPECIES: hypothetical protein [unclassified Sinorhizobium]|uniref:hypothetical protein n=1 Tax=unclassified Sinorhizobium TaxID=2613772 RepID=UPI00352475CE